MVEVVLGVSWSTWDARQPIFSAICELDSQASKLFLLLASMQVVVISLQFVHNKHPGSESCR